MSNPTIPPDINFNTYPISGITVNGNGHPVVRNGDMSLWDTVANVYVAIEQTNLVGPNS
jgi:hypothetical protein